MGKQLTEAQVGVFTGLRLVELLRAATLQAGYTYAFVERAIDEISVDRSNVFVDLGYAVSGRLYCARGLAVAQAHRLRERRPLPPTRYFGLP